VTDLVVEYGGSVSGEHGDGRARTQWNRKLYGEDVWSLFRDVKTAFDPDWLLNPGTVCGDHDMTEHLRFSPEYEFDAGFEPALEWANDNGMQGMVELCHGCGGCRGSQETTGGVMCPTYRAAEEESLSTRGRANMLRGAMNGELDAESTDPEFLAEVMDLCIGCKGCARDCPSEVDMAKLKAEVEHANHQENGSSLRDKLFANVDRLNAVASALAPLSNWAASLPGAGTIAEKTVGIARERDLPTFAGESFEDWFEKRGGEAASKKASGEGASSAWRLSDSARGSHPESPALPRHVHQLQPPARRGRRPCRCSRRRGFTSKSPMASPRPAGRPTRRGSSTARASAPEPTSKRWLRESRTAGRSSWSSPRTR